MLLVPSAARNIRIMRQFSSFEHLAEEKHAREAGPRSRFKRKSSWAVSSRASSHVASRNGSYQDGGVATRSRMSRSTRSNSGRSRTAFPTERGGPAGFGFWPSPSMVCHGPPRRFAPLRPLQTQRPCSFSQPLIRRGWEKEQGRWVWSGRSGANRRGGPWQTIEGEGQNPKPAGPPRSVGKAVRDLPLLERVDLDIRDRVATPPSWYEPFREATWDEALELTAQELLRLKRERGPASLACFSSAKCSNEENYLMMRMFRAALGTNNIDHCTRLCHSTSVAAMQRALNTSAASGSMREVEHAADVIFIAGANTTESHPVFGAAIK